MRDLGVVHVLTGNYAQASSYHHDALDIYTELGCRTHQAYALDELGIVSLATGALEGARTAHEQALELFTELGERSGRANRVRDAAPSSARRATPQKRYASLRRRLRRTRLSVAGDVRPPRLLNSALRGRAWLTMRVRRTGFRRCLEIQRALGNRCGKAEVLTN
ncbi:tetratricopeptide repeat protein [Streptomyces sp. NPDC085995]|uniref:tetratricopeptide repeat protein n=1 Tax=Streptomyces sp. NPDC085995 TaxID=3154861 RepID=UPI00342FD883